jgi:hypothetical protein
MLKLPTSIDTPQSLEAVRYDMEQLRAWLSDSVIKRKAGAKLNPEPSRTPQTEEALTSWLNGRPPTITKLSELIADLRELHPVIVHITLVTMPGTSMRQQIVMWLRTNCRADVLVGFSADRTIGGGIIIRTPNRIFDYSFRQRLSEGRVKIPEIIRHAR